MPIRTSTVVVLALAVALAACSRATEATTTLAPTTIASTAPSTVPSYGVSVIGPDLPGDLAAEVAATYEMALGLPDADPEVGPQLGRYLANVAAPALDRDLIVEPVATSAEAYGEHVAVVTAGDDVVLAVSPDGTDWRVVGVKLASLGESPWYGDAPRQIFVIGSDARTGEDPIRLRADSLHIISMTPDGAHISIVGIPRDSWVETPKGGMNKFTNIMSGTGPEAIVTTGETLTGLDIDGYIVTGFQGFAQLINAYGGFDVDIPFAMNEPKSKAFFNAGVQLLDGIEALAFARNRTLAGGDFTRSFHQGVIMQWGMREVHNRGIGEVPSSLALLEKHTWTDFDAETLLLISAGVFEQEDGLAVPNIVLDGVAGTAGSASVVFLSDSVQEAFADMADGILEVDNSGS